MQRNRLQGAEKEEEASTDHYFEEHASDHEFVSSGCELLNCVLGGGWPLGRVSNVVGDKSSGKTLLAIEAVINFKKKFPHGKARYNEVEAALDESYAAELGMSPDLIERSPPCYTVEDVFKDLDGFLDSLNDDIPGFYILDSLDAVSSASEMSEEFGKPSFGTKKAADMSKLFRLMIQKVEKKKAHIFIISQVRDNIGVMFGESLTRSGGRALDFYASQVIWLHQSTKLKKTRKGVERTIGIDIRVRCKKNKVGMPFRDCHFPILFGYGVDDVTAGVQWLADVNRLDAIFDDPPAKKAGITKYFSSLEKLSDDAYAEERKLIADAVHTVWYEIEKEFRSPRKKY